MRGRGAACGMPWELHRCVVMSHHGACHGTLSLARRTATRRACSTPKSTSINCAVVRATRLVHSSGRQHQSRARLDAALAPCNVQSACGVCTAHARGHVTVLRSSRRASLSAVASQWLAGWTAFMKQEHGCCGKDRAVRGKSVRTANSLHAATGSTVPF